MTQEQIDIRKMNEEIITLKKKVAELAKILEEDLEFARRTEEAYQRIEAGEGIEMDFDDFLKEIRKW